MANIGGPSQNRRELLAKVSQSILMYAAPIWAPVLRNKIYVKKAKSVIQLSATRVICAFRTVSHDAAGIKAGIIPPDILAMEIKRVYDRSKSLGRRKDERPISINEWQKRWTQQRREDGPTGLLEACKHG
ncbi:uncharacterized protein [Bactrocera oleae]|uniref:uncharacterized protein n=1 Tax=Bactrocera oleae TaxID=104688 RepID=UPI00387E3C5F